MDFRQFIKSNGAQRVGLPLAAVAACLLMALVAGCSHSHGHGRHGFVGFSAPQVPRFLDAPVAVLLTNSAAYSARVSTETEPLGGGESVQSGQLLCSGTKFFFVPELRTRAERKAHPGGFSFIWDSAGNSGFVLSEALQGYAPILSNNRITNIVSGHLYSAPGKFAGHPCQMADANVQLSDGSSAIFQMLRATDLNGLPVRINLATNPAPLTVTLSGVRLEKIPAGLFMPPDGFTRYSSAQAMADELAIRQNNLKRKVAEEPESFDQGQRRPGVR